MCLYMKYLFTSTVRATGGSGRLVCVCVLRVLCICREYIIRSLTIPSGLSPGYGEEVIFADGTFIDGSTLELSADGPLREPFVAYTQVRCGLGSS